MIGSKEYELFTSAFAMFLYKKEFKTGIMADIGRLQEFTTVQEQITKENEGKPQEEIDAAVGLALMPQMDSFMEVAFRMAYIFIKCANPNVASFDDWTKEVENFSFQDKWVMEVTELAVDSFCGQGASGTTQTTENKVEEIKQ